MKQVFDGEFMTAKELVKQIQDNLEPDAELDFLIFDHKNNKNDMFWGDIIDICMNVDVDDPNNYHRGGIIFETRNIKN